MPVLKINELELKDGPTLTGGFSAEPLRSGPFFHGRGHDSSYSSLELCAFSYFTTSFSAFVIYNKKYPS